MGRAVIGSAAVLAVLLAPAHSATSATTSSGVPGAATTATAPIAGAAAATAPIAGAAAATAPIAGAAAAPAALSACTRASLRRVRLVRTGLNVDRDCQLMYTTRKGRIIRVWRATTGKPGFRTRAGYWRIYYRVNRWQESGLYRGAWMYRPMYFSGGQAIHGSSTDRLVVPWPASHGCVRVFRANVDWLWRNGYAKVGTLVYVF
jgi:lipoprotein-anchoring transpeptidase ErfK/SrfK